VRRAAWIAAALVLGGVAIWISAPWWLPPGAGPPAGGRLELAGLDGPVRVSRDPFGVPHIAAASRRDAFAGLGLAHAQDRLWQMDLLRRAATGRLSELFGSSTLPEDRLVRTLGFGFAARAEAETLSPDARALLEAYASGVNRWIREIREGRRSAPFEYRWVGSLPETWKTADTLAIVRYRAWLIGRSLDTSLLLDRLVRDLGGLASQEFFPRLQRTEHMDGLVSRLLPLARVADRSAGVAGLRGRVGSNGLVVGSARSASGAPLLANDPHVELRIPPLFYAAHLRFEAGQTAGGTWPGVPVFWVGTNGRIAWGQVALRSSVSDLFEETLHPRDPYKYDLGGRWVAAERREERIRVSGGAELTLEVVSTRHGPLLGRVRGDGQLDGVALEWTGRRAPSGIESYLKVQVAGDWQEFREPLRELAAPAMTWLYADRDGNVGTQVVGRLPLRSIDTGLLPVPGSTGFYDWRGFMRFDDLPQSFGADVPWLIARSRPADESFVRPIAWLWTSPLADERAESLLSQASVLDLHQLVALQRDRRSASGPEEIRALLEGVEVSSGTAAILARLLLDWDGSTEIESTGAAAYHVFRYHLTAGLLRERLDPEQLDLVLAASEPVPGMLLARFLARVDPKEARGRVERALDEAWSWFGVELSSNPAKWTWGRVHQLRPLHDFERLGGPWLRWVGRARRLAPVPVPGSSDSLWTMYAEGRPPFAPRVGPGFRFAIDMASPDHPVFGLAGGQSGHPGSPHYTDGLDAWVAGRPGPLWMHTADVSYHATGVWELEPTEP
jgi:penicillin amidase